MGATAGVTQLYLLSGAAHSGSALFQNLTVLMHVLDGVDHTLRTLSHLSDGVGGVDQVPVALPDHLSELFLLMLDLAADSPLDAPDLLGVVPLEQAGWVFYLRQPERLYRVRSHYLGNNNNYSCYKNFTNPEDRAETNV